MEGLITAELVLGSLEVPYTLKPLQEPAPGAESTGGSTLGASGGDFAIWDARDIITLAIIGSNISKNSNARPERKRAPIHRYAIVEHRIHCETQYFWKHASIRSPQKLRQKNKKIYAWLRKNTVFCRGF